VQSQVLNLLNQLKMERQLSYVFISHDLSVVRYMSDRIMVMKQGQIVEIGPRDRVFKEPQHPYTQKLLASIMS
ncbi:MAG: ABC transporter ATP-binding protein, partial [Flavobacteriales bacterium]|nr:ABC transporter ATP-binding protein [Flavobacteriales bacterium]